MPARQSKSGSSLMPALCCMTVGGRLYGPCGCPCSSCSGHSVPGCSPCVALHESARAAARTEIWGTLHLAACHFHLSLYSLSSFAAGLSVKAVMEHIERLVQHIPYLKLNRKHLSGTISTWRAVRVKQQVASSRLATHVQALRWMLQRAWHDDATVLGSPALGGRGLNARQAVCAAVHMHMHMHTGTVGFSHTHPIANAAQHAQQTSSCCAWLLSLLVRHVRVLGCRP